LQAQIKSVNVKTVSTDYHSNEVLKSRYLSTFVWTRTLSSEAMVESLDSQQDAPSMLSEAERGLITSCNKYRVAVLQKYVHEQEVRRRMEEVSSPANSAAAVPLRYRPARVAPAIAAAALDPYTHEVTEPFLVRRLTMPEVAVLHADNRLGDLAAVTVAAAREIAGVTGSHGAETTSANELSHHHLFRAFLVIEGADRWMTEQSRIRNEVNRKRMTNPDATVPQAAMLSPNLKSLADVDALVTILQLTYQIQVSFFLSLFSSVGGWTGACFY
jgi:hypothetical protein